MGIDREENDPILPAESAILIARSDALSLNKLLGIIIRKEVVRLIRYIACSKPVRPVDPAAVLIDDVRPAGDIVRLRIKVRAPARAAVQ